ncbi:endonuclease/exonuclease/phosphatase family protein [Streptomyces goshikiensis]|uniref:endonuclease/exonuclease/phosphatase family protein n=1 Tax=Streptomyces goshikiensis TaxID=1942 RepID=UPI0036743E5A
MNNIPALRKSINPRSFPVLNVMTFNIHQLPASTPSGTPGTDCTTERASYAESLIRSRNCDVVVLTEAFNYDAELMRRRLQDVYPHQTQLVGQYCSGWTGGNWNSYSGKCSGGAVFVNGGVAILSKYRILEKHQLVFSSSLLSADYLSNKGVALVKIADRYREAPPVWLAGMHLQAKDSQQAQEVRTFQLSEFKQFAYEKTMGAPVIVAGDFNIPFYEVDVNDGQAPLNYSSGEYRFNCASLRLSLIPNQLGAGYSYDMVNNPRARVQATEADAKYQNVLDYVGCLARPDDYRYPVKLLGIDESGEAAPVCGVPSDHQSVMAAVDVSYLVPQPEIPAGRDGGCDG